MSKIDKAALQPKYRFPEFADSGEWERDMFENVFSFLQTNTYSRNDMNNNKGTTRNIHYGDVLIKYNIILNDASMIPFLNETIDTSKYHEQSFVQNGDVIIADTAEDTMAGKAVEVQNSRCRILSGLHTFLCRPKNPSAPMYFGYYLNSPSYHNRIIPLLTGTKVFSISKGNISKTTVLKPGFKEQQKIANCLFSLDELITAEEKKRTALKDHKKGLMQKLFPAKGKTLPEWRFLEFRDCGEWEERKLDEVGEVVTGNTPPTSNPEYYNGDYLFVSPADISDNRYVMSTRTTLTESGFKKTRCIKENSILFVCIGSTIGKIAQNKYKCATNQQINSLVPYEPFDNDFIYYALEFIANSVADLAGIQAVPIVNKTQFSNIFITIPSKKLEQQKIAGCLSSIDTLITSQSERIEALKRQKQALMQGLFPLAQEEKI